MKLSRLLIIVFAAIFCQMILHHNCYSANWQYVATGSDKAKSFIDIDNIKININKKEIRFWIKYVDPDNSSMKVYFLCNYDEKSYMMLDIIKYDKHGNSLGSSTPNPPEKDYIAPDSSIELCLEAALSFKGIKPAE